MIVFHLYYVYFPVKVNSVNKGRKLDAGMGVTHVQRIDQKFAFGRNSR